MAEHHVRYVRHVLKHVPSVSMAWMERGILDKDEGRWQDAEGLELL